MRPERHNSVKVLLFFDIGGSMGLAHQGDRELFSAARTEFSTWSISTSTIACTSGCGKRTVGAFRNPRRPGDVLHKYPHDYKAIFRRRTPR